MDQKFTLPKYIPQLDGLRAIGIILVVIVHWNPLGHQYNDVIPHVLRLPRIGWIGVDLFFAISGFLITGILISTKGKSGFFKNFMARRALRIFPLYYLVLTLVLVIFPLLPDFYEYIHTWDTPLGRISYWLYFSNFMMGFGPAKHDMLHITWSLCIEEQFYLVFPLFVYRYSNKTIARLCIFILIISPIIRGYLLFYLGNHVGSVQFLSPLKLDSICAGVLLRLLIENITVEKFQKIYRYSLYLLPTVPLGILAMSFLQEGQTLTGGQLVGQNHFNATIGLSFLAYSSVVLLIIGIGSKPGSIFHKILTNKVLLSIGMVSYGIYLYHEMVRLMFTNYFLGVMGWPEPTLTQYFLIYMPLSLAGTLLVTYSSWYFFEKPILKLKKFFPNPK